MIYEHEFSEESREALSKFMKACENLKDYHEPKEEERAKWKPFVKNLGQPRIAQSKKQSSIGTVSRNCEPKDIEKNLGLLKVTQDNNQSSIETESRTHEPKAIEKLKPSMPNSDISYIITNELFEEEDMLNFYIDSLQKEPEERIEEAYRNALLTIDLSGLIKIGETIMNINRNSILVKCYCKELLFQMMSQMFSDNLKKFFEEFCDHYNSLVIKQLVHFMKVQDELEIFFLYINSKSSVEDQILREFLITYEEPFLRKYILVLDSLIHKGTEYNSIKMVIDILSCHAVEYKEDKDYGKLLLKIIDGLGPKVDSLKSKIDWILSVHVSMWKIKLKKMYNKYSVEM